MKRKVVGLVMAVMMTAGMLSGCGSQTEEKNEVAQETKKKILIYPTRWFTPESLKIQSIRF